jgi:hypothetical protein
MDDLVVSPALGAPPLRTLLSRYDIAPACVAEFQSHFEQGRDVPRSERSAVRAFNTGETIGCRDDAKPFATARAAGKVAGIDAARAEEYGHDLHVHMEMDGVERHLEPIYLEGYESGQLVAIADAAHQYRRADLKIDEAHGDGEPERHAAYCGRKRGLEDLIQSQLSAASGSAS